MSAFTTSTINKFYHKEMAALLGAENGGIKIDLELSFNAKIKTPLGMKIFKYKTENIGLGVGENISETIVKPDKKVTDSLKAIKKRMESNENEEVVSSP